VEANQGVTALTFYVDGKIIGSQAASLYFKTDPTCGQEGTVSVTKSPKGYSYSVKDQNGIEWWSGVVNITANGCLLQQLFIQ
jgi:hypothetical protein